MLLLSLIFACTTNDDMTTADQAPAEQAAVEAPAEKAAETPEAAPVVDMDAPGVVITSTKKETVEDQHHMDFKSVDLKLADASNPGTLTGTVTLDLASWASPISVRDERVREVFFKVAEYPTGTFTVTKASGFGPTEVGASSEGMVTGTFDVSGGSFEGTMKVKADRTAENAWHFETTEPMTFNVEQLGAAERVHEVAILCGVPLSNEFKLQFQLDQTF